MEEVLVRPEYRGGGAGRALMSAFEEHAARGAAAWSRWLPGARPRSPCPGLQEPAVYSARCWALPPTDHRGRRALARHGTSLTTAPRPQAARSAPAPARRAPSPARRAPSPRPHTVPAPRTPHPARRPPHAAPHAVPRNFTRRAPSPATRRDATRRPPNATRQPLRPRAPPTGLPPAPGSRTPAAAPAPAHRTPRRAQAWTALLAVFLPRPGGLVPVPGERGQRQPDHSLRAIVTRPPVNALMTGDVSDPSAPASRLPSCPPPAPTT